MAFDIGGYTQGGGAGSGGSSSTNPWNCLVLNNQNYTTGYNTITHNLGLTNTHTILIQIIQYGNTIIPSYSGIADSNSIEIDIPTDVINATTYIQYKS